MHKQSIPPNIEGLVIIYSYYYILMICSWVYCSGCGLVALKNEATRRRMAQSCESMEE